MEQRKAHSKTRKFNPRSEPLPCFVYTIEEKGGVDRAPQGPMKGDETNEDRDNDKPHDGSRDVIDDLQVDHQSARVLPVVYMTQEQTTNDGAGDPSKKEADPSPNVKADEEPSPEYDRISRSRMFLPIIMQEVYAEDVDHHMAGID